MPAEMRHVPFVAHEALAAVATPEKGMRQIFNNIGIWMNEELEGALRPQQGLISSQVLQHDAAS